MDTNIKEIIKGYSNFQSVKFKKNEERYKNLVEEGQNPKPFLLGVVIPVLFLTSLQAVNLVIYLLLETSETLFHLLIQTKIIMLLLR